jgi:ABC-type tungstate transport system permease subunit
MAVNPAKSGVNYDLAKKYIAFVTGEEGQKNHCQL